MNFGKKPRLRLLELLSAQENDPHRGNEEKDADDLEWEVKIAEQREAHPGDIIEGRVGKLRLGVMKSGPTGDDLGDCGHKSAYDQSPTQPGGRADFAVFFGPEVEEHDDEKK
jgi:hypothetical protein